MKPLIATLLLLTGCSAVVGEVIVDGGGPFAAECADGGHCASCDGLACPADHTCTHASGSASCEPGSTGPMCGDISCVNYTGPSGQACGCLDFHLGSTLCGCPASSPPCDALHGACMPNGPGGLCNGIGYEDHDPGLCPIGHTCCAAPDSAGNFVHALDGRGACGDVLCTFGNVCSLGTDSYLCTPMDTGPPSDGGVPGGTTCGQLRCGHGCTCTDPARSRCSC